MYTKSKIIGQNRLSCPFQQLRYKTDHVVTCSFTDVSRFSVTKITEVFE